MAVTIRDALETDLDAINDIYNHYVLNSTSTFHETPLSLEGRRQWWFEHGEKYPVLVAEDGGKVVGWADLSAYSGRCAYRQTVANGIYLRPDACGKGLGRRLLGELLERGRSAGYHSVIAVVAAEQTASVGLHKALGFVEVGQLREVGFKFGRRLDVLFLQRML